MTTPPARVACKVQCKACPWRVDVTPQKDIPGGYCPRKHANLAGTIKEGLASISDTRRIMACHESTGGDERPCVGWAVNQLGAGNNIGLRLLAMRDTRFHGLQLVGPQHERFEDTLPKPKRRKRTA